jgi:hypothetical protein
MATSHPCNRPAQYDVLSKENSSGVLCDEMQSVANVISLKRRGTLVGALGLGFKRSIQNCVSTKLVMQGHQYPNATKYMKPLNLLSQKNPIFPKSL